jgi:hypothetical protein
MIRRSCSRLALLTGIMLIMTGCAGGGPSAFLADPLSGQWTVAVMPFANYTPARDAAPQLQQIAGLELFVLPHVSLVEPGIVEAALAEEPWILSDRIPPDVVDSLGVKTGADALLLGSVLEFGYRDSEVGPMPQVALSLRLIETPGGEILWSSVHSRDGEDRESVFGMGREQSLQSLAIATVREMIDTFPKEEEGGRRPPAKGDSQ